MKRLLLSTLVSLTFYIFCLTVPAEAAITLTQHAGKDAGSVSSSSQAFASSNTAGNFVAVVIRSGQSGQLFNVSDSRGNTYRQAIQLNVSLDLPNGDTLAIYYAENIAGGANTVTVGQSQSATLRFAVMEFSGVAASNSLDGVVSGQATSTSPNSGSVTTTTAGDLLLGALISANENTFTAGTNFTIEDQVPAAPNSKVVSEDFIQTAAGPAAATATLSSSDIWGAALAAFRPAMVIVLPDLGLSKSHIGSFTQGQAGASYSIAVSNIGAGPTGGTVTMTDTLPVGLTATALSGTGWNCTVVPASCSRGDVLPAGASYPTISVTVNVASNAASTVTNTATVSGGGETNTANDSASDVTTINAVPDLTLTKTHVGAFTQGQTGASYTITVTNSGPGVTSGTVTMTDALPTGLTATALSGTGWNCTVAPASCTRSDGLAGSASYPVITLTASVAGNAPSSVTNTASVSGGGEINTGNNSASDVTTINAVPDLTVTKTHIGAFTQGQTGAAYAITVTNSGAGATSGTVAVIDTLPSGLTATALSGSGWSCTVAPASCTRSDVLAANSNYPAITLTVNVDANAPGNVTNTASVSGGGEINSANNSASDLTTINLLDTISPSAPGTLSGTAPDSTHVNLSWGAATDNVAVTGYQVARCDGTCSIAGGGFVQIGSPTNISFSDSALTPGSTYSYAVRAVDAATNSGPYSNVVTLTTPATIPALVVAFSFDEPSGATVTDSSGKGNTGTISNATRTLGKYGNALSFNGTNALVNVLDSASLHLTTTMTLEAWVNPATSTALWRDVIYKADDNYYLEGTSMNGGLPAGSVRGAAGPTYGTSPLPVNTWSHLTLTYDGTALRLYVNGAQVGSQAYTGSITTSSNPLQIGGDSLYGQFFSGLIDEVRVYNVALTPTQIQSDMNSPIGGSFPVASLSPASLNFGTVSTGTSSTPQNVTLTNIGGAALAISGISITGANSTDFSQSNNCAATLATSVSCTISVTFTPTAAGARAASVQVSDNAAGAPHMVALAGTGQSPSGPDLTLTKTHSGAFTQGQTGATYSLVVHNSGTSSTSGTVTVTDTLPTGLTATAMSGTGWSCTLSTRTCTRSSSLAANSSYSTITLTVSVASNAPGSVTNTATVSGGGESNTANDTASDPTTINAGPQPDLTLTKTHTGTFTQGQTGAIYSLVARNSGTATTSGTVTVLDTLPAGLTATALSGSGWNCTVVPASCTRSDVLAGSASYPAITVTVNVAANAPGTLTNTASISGGGETNTANNSASDLTTIIAVPDLTLTKTHVGAFTQGQTGASYTVTVSNSGPGVTSGTVTMTDTLPTGLTATALSGAGWNCTVVPSSCTRSDVLASGASYPAITVTVNVAANAPGTLTNTASVSGGGEINTGNNSVSDVTTINAVPDLTLTKTHSGTFTQGQTGASYTITVTNSGAGATSGTVTMTDTLPTGLTASALSGTGWNCTVAPASCTRSDVLASSASYPAIMLTVSVASNAPGSVTNTASVSGGGEINTGNNSASDVTTINAAPDLTLTKTHVGAFTQGQTGASYTITVTNSGAGATSGTVAVIDTLPASLTATALSGTGWSCTVAPASCTRSDVLAAHSNYPAITLTVSVDSNAPASVTNTASVSGGGEVNTANNSSSDVTAINVLDSQVPSAPGTLSGSASSGTHVDLTWGPATDNVGVTDYRVERCDGVCTIAGGGFVKIAAPLTTSFSDSGLTPSTTYSYVVRAEDAASNLGPYSNVVTVTTLATVPELVVAFSFDESSGSTVTDSSGKGNSGTISNATRTLGKYGNALSFNGTNALVSVVDSASLHLTNAMTLEAWVNPATANATWRDVIYKADDNYYLEASSTNGGSPAGGTSGSSVPAYGTVSLPVNTWSHLALTYDGSALRLYVNGTQAGSQAYTGSIATSTNPLQIGGDSLYSQFFNGLIDEVRVYNIALTPTQILSDMNTPLGASFPVAGVSPANLNFGTIPTGTPSAPQNVTLTNSGGVALSISGISVTGVNSPDFSQSNSCPASLAISTSCTISVTFTPGAAGAEIASVRIDDNSVGSPHLVALNGIGAGFSIAPRISVLTPTMGQQFGVTGGSGGSVQWAVDGVPGGSPTSGTISGTGLYAPPQVMGTHTVAVTDQGQTSTATVYVTTYPGTLTHHNDNERTGQNLNETVLTPSNVNPATFGKLLSYDLDGLSMASPLYVAGVTIPTMGVRNVVYVATQHDSVYAFDADGLSVTPLWKTSFLVSGAVAVPSIDTGECCDIAPEIGITGTPVIDLASNILYVVAKTKEGGSYFQRLHALDITTGVEKTGGWPITLQASVSGTGQGSSGGQIAFDALHENQRPALLLSNGVVYIGFGSHGDIQPYHGWVLGYNVTTLQQTMAINVSPNADGGGIWQANGGPAADSAGNVYIITGNGAFTANVGNGKDYGDSFVKISTAGATAGTVVDYFTPYDQSTINAANFDLGAAGPLLLPDQPGAHPHLMVSAGKNNTIYLVDRDNMGHINSANNDNQIVQSLVDIFPFGTPEPGNYSGAVYFNGTVYFGPIADNIQAFQLNNGLLSTSAVRRTQDVYKYPGASMAISANGASNGLLWAIQRNGDCGADLSCSSAAPGVLRAYDTGSSGNVLTQVYSSDQMGTRDAMDFATKFSVPLVANGKVFVGSMTKLTVFGLLP